MEWARSAGRRWILPSIMLLLSAQITAGCARTAPEAIVVTAAPDVTVAKALPPDPVIPQTDELTQAELAFLANVSSSVGDQSVIPAINRLLPAQLPTANASHLSGQAAVPKKALTAGYAKPGDTIPTIVLTADTDTAIEPLSGRWTVVDTMGNDWVAVLVPVGRRALPSQDKNLVNHAMAWVHKRDLNLSAETSRIEINTEAKTLTVKNGSTTIAKFPVGVGTAKTPTPKGLCSVIGHVATMSGGPQILTSCQSEAMDSWAGYPWATTAIHYSLDSGKDIGIEVSNGCVRVNKSDYDKYLNKIPIGTPIIIT